MTDKIKSVERGRQELLSGLGEVVTDGDTALEEVWLKTKRQ